MLKSIWNYLNKRYEICLLYVSICISVSVSLSLSLSLSLFLSFSLTHLSLPPLAWYLITPTIFHQQPWVKLSANLQETNLISGLHFKVNDSASWPQAAERSGLKLNINELINHHKQFIVLSVINVLSVMYRVFIKYCVFSIKFCDFSELCQFCCSAGFLPAWCVYTHWQTEGKQRKAWVWNILKSSGKHTIINEHPVV